MLPHLVVLLPTIFCSPPPLEVVLPNRAGVTSWVEGKTARGEAWTARVQPSQPGWLALELEGDPAADLDLLGRWKGSERLAASHRSREVLLLPLEPGRPVEVRVPQGAGSTSHFRLGFTFLTSEGQLSPGETKEWAIEDSVRRQLWTVSSVCQLRSRLALSCLAGEVDLIVFDERLDPIDIGCRVGGEHCLLSMEAEERYYVLLQSPQQARYRLQLQRPGKGVKSFPPDPLDQFLDRLAQTPEQGEAIAALRRHPDFVSIRFYLKQYPGGIPFSLRVVPGLRARGVERFGTYSQGRLTINPAIVGHIENVQELLDTLVHELIHALLALPRADHFPLEDDVTDAPHDALLRLLDTSRDLEQGRVPEPWGSYLDLHYGPSASNPQRDYTDINSGAQRLIVKVIEHNLRRTGLGQETLVFENVRRREQRQEEAQLKER